MGYSTDFDGILKFNNPLSVEQDAFLRTICSGEMEDVDKHPEWSRPANYHGYIQLVISKDQSGIEWDGNEKFYDAVDAVNTVIMTMQDKFPEFGLEGSLLAQGEEVRDRWYLVISNGLAERREIDIGSLYKCPHCREDFPLSDAEKIT